MSGAENAPAQRKKKKCCGGGALPLEEQEVRKYAAQDNFQESDGQLRRLYNIIHGQEGNTSTKTHLTEDMVNLYENGRTPMGVSLARCVHINAKDKDEPFPRIIDEHCLAQFKDFFRPVLKDAQGRSGPACESGGDVSASLVKALQEYEGQVVGVDIEVVRNVSGYEIGEGLSGNTAAELGKLLRGALEEAKMGGEFVSVGDKATMKVLLDNKFRVSNQADSQRLLEMAQASPDGRFVYYGTTNPPSKFTQLTAVVNIGDHLRLASTDNSIANAAKAFKTLTRCLIGIQKYINQTKAGENANVAPGSGEQRNAGNNSTTTKSEVGKAGESAVEESTMDESSAYNPDEPVFARSPDFGFVTYNPTEVGSGVNCRVLVRIPLLKSLANFEQVAAAVAKDLSLVSVSEQIAADPELVCFGNKSSVGRKESETVDFVLQNVGNVLKMEKDMRGSNPRFDAGVMAAEPADYLKARIDENRECKSYTRKVLTKSMVAQYKNLETPRGGRLAHCIRVNAYSKAVFPRASDPDAYLLFRQLFEPILKEYNGIDRIDHPDGDFGDMDQPPNIQEYSHPQVKSYRVRVARNVDGIGFPPIMTPTDRVVVEHKLKAALGLLKGDLMGTYHPLATFDASLVGDPRLVMAQDNERSRTCGVYRNWPDNRGIFVLTGKPEATESVVWVNEEDHFRLVAVDLSGKSLVGAFSVARRVMAHFDASFPHLFAKDPKLGYMTCCPSELGSGLRVSAMVKLNSLHLPSRASTLSQVCERCCLQIRGSEGEHSRATNGLFDVSLKARLGMTEIDCVAKLLTGLKRLIDADEY